MRVVIVDDERLAIMRLQHILEGIEEVEVVATYTNYSELLNDFPRLQPDAAFLDIDMPGMNGLELAANLQGMELDTEIVFITAYDQYALDAFRVNALDYLLKPVDEIALRNTIHRIFKRKERAPAKKKESTARIQCFGHYIVSRLSDGSPVDFPTAKAEELLAYFLIHRDTSLSKWSICESLWPEHEPQKAEQNLHTTVFRMKKTLLDNGIQIQLSSKKGFYHFQLLESCDYVRFEELRREGPTQIDRYPAEAEEVLRQYKGPLFGWKDYAWCEADKERANQGFRDMSKTLARLYMKRGEYRQVQDFLQFFLSIVPYDEEGHEMMLRIYMHRKDRTSFSMHFNKMKEVFQQEMGMDPPAFMEQMYVEMMNDA
ncbi:response regulator [Paenibacillus barcinonensis]|uniref:response regulator n=1 Tax=Paenibacillus TaxID=44249 RepID=UPI001C124FE5|nr:MULTISPECIES: response regulator [Paenibacillus]MBU5354685.1 response regulator [Paenibacillus barcinonensis]MDM5279855.1 response regulator [Paenibacillus silvae]